MTGTVPDPGRPAVTPDRPEDIHPTPEAPVFTKTFITRTAERAVKTAAQAAAALLIGSNTGLLDSDWLGVVSVAGMAGVVSVLTSIGSGRVGDDDSPSLVD